MKQGYELKIEYGQRLALTPSLLQAINVLQLNAAQLEQYVQEQLLSNPMLEIDESAHPDEEKAVDWAEFARHIAYEPARQDEDLPDENREWAQRSDVTLADHLSAQLKLSGLRGDILPAALYIASCLDEDGYLRISAEEIAEQTGAGLAVILQALLHVQGMDPAGIGARDLTECLSLQLIRKGLDTPLAMLLVKTHLADIAANRIGTLAKTLGVKPAAVQDACDVIKTLDPKPGRQFGSDANAHYIFPDVFIELRDGALSVIVNETASPRLIISPYYRHLLEEENADAQLKDFLKDRLNAASWLIRSIQQRHQTIALVTRAIADRQHAFLTKGEALAPMTLAQIAEAAGVHESTVSRCTSGKFVQTPRGLFELKDLFGGGLSAGTGEVSTESVKKQICAYIEGEDGRNPLSDLAIAQLLQDEKGISISRRTVAKYRDSLGIPTSAGRKRFE